MLGQEERNHRTVAQLERYNHILYTDLEREQKAIQNWQRMKILIAILKTCGNRMEKVGGAAYKEEKRDKTLDEYMLKFIHSPDERYMRAWSVIASLFYLLGLFQDSLSIAFHLYSLLGAGQKMMATARTMIMFADVVITFFTAIPKEVRVSLSDSHDDPRIRKRER